MKKSLLAMAALSAMGLSAAAGFARQRCDGEPQRGECRMFLDALGLLSDAQAVTADAYTTNTIDLGNPTPKNEIGNGEPMCLLFTVDVAADGTTTDETYTFNVVQSENANLSSHDVLAARTIGYATLVAGYQFVVPIPPGSVTKRYLGGQYDVGGTTPTITCTCALMPMSMVEKRKYYAKGYTVS